MENQLNTQRIRLKSACRLSDSSLLLIFFIDNSMTSNNNQILPPSNIWSHFISGRLNPSTNIIPLVPPNWMFPYLPINKQQHFESLPNPYSLETIQMFRSMLNRRNPVPQNVVHPNILPKNPCVPPLFGLQKSVDFFLTRSPGSSNITSPIDQGFNSVGELGSNFDNIDGQKSGKITFIIAVYS